MNKSVHPAVAALIIAGAVLIFGVKYWLDQRILELPRPGLMQPHPAGGVVVLLGLSLYHLAESGELLTTLDLEPLGVTEMVGDFAFFTNGDLLIRTTSASQSLSDNLATFGRLENSSYDGEGEQNMLSRCVLAAKTCVIFTRQLPALNRTFRLHVDWSDDTVFVADTSRHRVARLTLGATCWAVGKRCSNSPISYGCTTINCGWQTPITTVCVRCPHQLIILAQRLKVI